MAERDQIRKIQFTGKSSYIVSLPKDGIKDQGLKQGDQVTVGRDGSTILEVTPVSFGKPSGDDSSVLIFALEEDLSTLVRALIALNWRITTPMSVSLGAGTRIAQPHRVALRVAVRRVRKGAEMTAESTDGVTV
jgi:Phosphate uptake regulator